MAKRLYKQSNGEKFEDAIMSAENVAPPGPRRKGKAAKRKEVKISLTIVGTIAASYLLSLFMGFSLLSVNAQDVIYSNNKISIAAKKMLSNDHLVIKKHRTINENHKNYIHRWGRRAH